MYNNLTINQSVKPLDMLWCIPRCLLTHLPGVKVSPHRAQFSYSPWLAWTALDWRGVWCKIKGDNDNAWWYKLVNIILFSSSPDESPCSSGSESGEGDYTARQKVKYRWEKQNNFENYEKKTPGWPLLLSWEMSSHLQSVRGRAMMQLNKVTRKDKDFVWQLLVDFPECL